MYDDSFKKRYKYAPVAISISNTERPTAPHIHNEIEMLYINQGSAEIKIGEEAFCAQAGHLLFVNPYEVHSVTVKVRPYCHQCICFDCSLIADKAVAQAILNGSVQIPHLFGNGCENTPVLAEAFSKLFAAADRGESSLLFESSAYISAIFASLVKNKQLITKRPQEKSSVFCKSVIEYISSHYTEKISSKSIAEELFYTQNHFCRTFSKNFGVPFSEYLNMYRVLVSTELLKDKNKKISDVAYSCGFGDPVYFAKCFKKHKGISPSEYQKNQYNT